MSANAGRRYPVLGVTATRFIVNTLLYLILTAGAVVAMVPMLWTVSSSLKDTAHVFSVNIEWIPRPALWSNYSELFVRLPFVRYVSNTMIIVASNVVSSVLMASIAAFAFARLRAPAKALIFYLVISTMLLPSQVTLIPRYIIYSKLGMIDTYWPLILPGWLGGGAFEIFLFRQFFLGLPLELDDAARIDGCSTWRIYLNIVMPLAKPVVATLAVFNFIWAWNDLMGPLIYLNTMEKFTLPLGLATLRLNAERSSRWELVMGGAVVSIIPPLVVFFLGQQYFVQGIALSGIKG